MEFNGGDLVVSEHQKILIKDASGSYYFTPANTVNVNSDYLVKYTDDGIVEELITSAYKIENQTIHTIGIEDIDVYLSDGYIVHNPPSYDTYSCGGGQIGCLEFVAYDPGPFSTDCLLVYDSNRGTYNDFCVQTCDTCGEPIGYVAAEEICGAAESEICGGGDGDTSPGPQGPTGAQGPSRS